MLVLKTTPDEIAFPTHIVAAPIDPSQVQRKEWGIKGPFYQIPQTCRDSTFPALPQSR